MALTYAFEEIGDDLPRPPMAALRALFLSGVVISPNGWRSMTLEARMGIVKEGSSDHVSAANVRGFMRGVPLHELKMVAVPSEPNATSPPAAVKQAIGGSRALSVEDWRVLRQVDRFILNTLATNTRLFSRAIAEILRNMGRGTSAGVVWTGLLAHVEIALNVQAIDRLGSPEYLDGRAILLARVCGVRAARSFPEIFDLYAGGGAGPVEIDSTVRRESGRVVWQAHVSAWDGAFCPIASLAAATTAAVAVLDMARYDDPAAQIVSAGIREEAWQVGNVMFQDESTAVYSVR